MAEEHADKKPPKYEFFVDGNKYETEHASLTGAQIKALIPGFDPTYSLFLEEQGDAPDLQIGDDTSVSLQKDKGPRRFYTVPPATFGHP